MVSSMWVKLPTPVSVYQRQLLRSSYGLSRHIIVPSTWNSLCIKALLQNQRTFHSAVGYPRFHQFQAGGLQDLPKLLGQKDRYNAIHVDLEVELPSTCTTEQFDYIVQESLTRWAAEDSCGIWLRVTLQQSALIAVAAKYGFRYHHAENEHAVLCKWIEDSPCRLPRFATHQVGVAGCVVDEKSGNVLVIRDKNQRFKLWKFPGGLSELGEDISKTAVREVYEETGVESEFRSILTLRQQHDQPGAFGRSDIYLVCLMHPLTFDLKPCFKEVEACRWMHIDELAQNVQTSAITLRIVQLVKKGLLDGFDQVGLVGQEFHSVYKGLKYILYNRHLDENLASYTHSIIETHRKSTTN